MKRQYYYSEDNSLIKLISVAILFYIGNLVFEYSTNRANFWKHLFYGVFILIIIISGILGWKKWRENKNRKRFDKLIEEVRSTSQEENIINFINRFGLEGRRRYGWSFRNHFFDWERINDLERDLSRKIAYLRTDKQHRDIFILLRYYIQIKEERLTRESIKKEPQKFANLTGVEFEKLIYRLATAMGYSAEWIGKSGDQGGDLIANRDGGRLLIQAKCYRNWSTGNEAVQQVVAAMKIYDCNEAVVITTSYFTPEAITLAKVNNVELISKEKLQGMLIKYLKESWS
jgi:HJR/Mrr/RecB family endonuclease